MGLRGRSWGWWGCETRFVTMTVTRAEIAGGVVVVLVVVRGQEADWAAVCAWGAGMGAREQGGR